MDKDLRILFYGYGNPGRQDDALGIRFIDQMEIWIEEKGYKNIAFDSNYQLNIEDADTISEHDIVFFVDASMEQLESFTITEVKDSNAQVEFTMHAISPGVVLSLCKQIYEKAPKAYLVHIKGYEWELEFEKGLTEKAEGNLKDTLEFIQGKMAEIVKGSFKL